MPQQNARLNRLSPIRQLNVGTKKMIIKPPDNGIVDGARLLDAEDFDSRKNIRELILHDDRLVMIKNKGNHLVVKFMTKSSGKPHIHKRSG